MILYLLSIADNLQTVFSLASLSSMVWVVILAAAFGKRGEEEERWQALARRLAFLPLAFALLAAVIPNAKNLLETQHRLNQINCSSGKCP